MVEHEKLIGRQHARDKDSHGTSAVAGLNLISQNAQVRAVSRPVGPASTAQIRLKGGRYLGPGDKS
jgi:hypothetical protein